MPQALKDLINKGSTRLIQAGGHLETAIAYLNTAGVQLTEGYPVNAGSALISAAYSLVFFRGYLLDKVGSDYGMRSAWKSALHYINNYGIWEIPEAEVTMDAILSVMLTASDKQLKNFIGLVDAYRQSLWNKDFDAEYFAAIARGFEQWG